MNRGSVRTLAASFAQDPNQTRYSATRYNDAINRSQEQFALDTRALFKDTSFTSVADQATYSLSSDFMYEEYVTYAGLKLTPISRVRILEIKSADDWTDDTGTPTHFIIDPEEAQKKLLLYPKPTTAGDTIGLRYYPLPAAMSSDSDTPLNSSALMAQFHMALAAFTAWILLLSEQSTPQIVEKRNELLKIYTDGVNKATETFKNTASAPLRMRPRVAR